MDWVVNDYTYSSVNQVIGNNGQIALPLTFPKFIQAMDTFPGGVAMGGYAYPEQSKGQRVYAVRGHYSLRPGTWVAGNTFKVMCRVVKKPLDYASGVGAIVDPGYDLFAAQYANERFLWQRLHFEGFGFGDLTETHPLHIKCNEGIAEDEALYMFLENQSGITISIVCEFYLRTLMRADE